MEPKTKRFCAKVTWFSFFLSLLVVWVHAGNAELFLGTGEAPWLENLETFLAEDIGQIAVPGFFLLSGYLFFRCFDLSQLSGKWGRRVKSTLIPYLLWNFLYYLGYVVASRLPGLSDVVGKGKIGIGLSELAAAVLHFRYNPVFWYLFQLILLIILAPLLYLILRTFMGRAVFFAVLGVLLLFDVRLPLVNADALFYYSLAGSLALCEKTRILCEKTGMTPERAAGGLFALLAAVVAGFLGGRTFMPLFFVVCRTLAVGGLWFLLPAVLLPGPAGFVRRHFFLYATHFAFVRFLNKTAAFLLPPSWHPAAVPLLLFLAMPFLALAFSEAFYSWLKLLSPRFCRLLNGGR